MIALDRPAAEAVAVMLTRTYLAELIDVDVVLHPNGLLDDRELRDVVSSWRRTASLADRALLDVLMHVAVGDDYLPEAFDVLDNNQRQAATLALAIKENR